MGVSVESSWVSLVIIFTLNKFGERIFSNEKIKVCEKRLRSNPATKEVGRRCFQQDLFETRDTSNIRKTSAHYCAACCRQVSIYAATIKTITLDDFMAEHTPQWPDQITGSSPCSH